MTGSADHAEAVWTRQRQGEGPIPADDERAAARRIAAVIV
jgi:hypothetical protein